MGAIQPSTLRADQDARQDLAHDARLAQALEDFGEKFGGGEHHQHGERNVGGRSNCQNEAGHTTIMDARGSELPYD